MCLDAAIMPPLDQINYYKTAVISGLFLHFIEFLRLENEFKRRTS